jgi:hypothetical protein
LTAKLDQVLSQSRSTLTRATGESTKQAERAPPEQAPPEHPPVNEAQDSDGEWETVGYEETEEGRKAKHIVHGHFQVKRHKRRLFSYHWNVRKY